MLLSLEDSVTAFENQVRADRILAPVEILVPIFLLGQKNHRAMIRWLPWNMWAIFLNSTFNVAPDIRRIVPVEVDDGLGLRVITFRKVRMFIFTLNIRLLNSLLSLLL